MSHENDNEEEITEPADESATPDENVSDAEADAEMQAALDPETAPEADEDAGDGAVEEDPDDPVEVLRAQVADLNDKLLRSLADAENTRRIASREKTHASKYASANFAREMLQVADNLGMAMMTVSADAREADANLENLYVGIDMTMKALLAAFESQGIKPIEAEGKPFDHNFHEAVGQVENPDVADGTVVQVIRQGFTIYDRLLRPAQVLVSTGGPKADTNSENKAEKAAEAKDGAEGEAAPADGQGAYETGERQPGGQVDQET